MTIVRDTIALWVPIICALLHFLVLSPLLYASLGLAWFFTKVHGALAMAVAWLADVAASFGGMQ